MRNEGRKQGGKVNKDDRMEEKDNLGKIKNRMRKGGKEESKNGSIIG